MGNIRETARRTFTLIGPIWAIGISAYILFAPTIRSTRVSVSLDRAGARTQSAPNQSESSWFETFGPSALKFFLFPVSASLLPLLGATAGIRILLGAVSALSLAVFCVLAIFSIGSFYLPSVIALSIALALEIFGNWVARKKPGLTQKSI